MLADGACGQSRTEKGKDNARCLRAIEPAEITVLNCRTSPVTIRELNEVANFLGLTVLQLTAVWAADPSLPLYKARVSFDHLDRWRFQFTRASFAAFVGRCEAIFDRRSKIGQYYCPISINGKERDAAPTTSYNEKA